MTDQELRERFARVTRHVNDRDWSDVQRRASKIAGSATRPLLRRTRLLAAAAASVAVLVLAVFGGMAISGGSKAFSVPNMSHRGLPVNPETLTPRERDVLSSARLDQEHIHLLGERAGIRFYVTRAALDGRPCFATGLERGDRPHFGNLACPPAEGNGARGAPFPSDEYPILDYSPLHGVFGEAQRLQWLAGFAADGVAHVEVLDVAGDLLVRVAVTNNFYASREVPDVGVSAIVAKDGQGKTLHVIEIPPLPNHLGGDG